jgi:hypothetical protein
MESWGVVADSPYFAVTDRDGRFEFLISPPAPIKFSCGIR